MANITGGKELANINRQDSSLGALISRIIENVNHGFSQAGISPVGQSPPPPPPNAVNVTVTGEMAHVRIVDNNPTTRPRNYFTEVFADPERTQLLHVEHHGVSRDATLNLPTNTPGGVMQPYYLHSYSQTPGAPPSSPVPYSPVITMDGTTNGSLPQSAGSGTGNAQGTQVAQGFGSFPTRKATGVKRTV